MFQRILAKKDLVFSSNRNVQCVIIFKERSAIKTEENRLPIHLAGRL